jgi:Abnormal spindle-like microcephaly-assoc'd, ASPM-SPD-2-Hydin
VSRPKSSIFAFSVLSLALLFAIGLAAPGIASAWGENEELLLVNSERLDFGNVVIGTTSPAQTVTATNTTDDDTISFFGIFPTPSFLKVSNTCVGSLGAGQTCQIDVACKPRSSGPIAGALVFVYSSKDSSGPRDGDDAGFAFDIVEL